MQQAFRATRSTTNNLGSASNINTVLENVAQVRPSPRGHSGHRSDADQDRSRRSKSHEHSGSPSNKVQSTLVSRIGSDGRSVHGDGTVTGMRAVLAQQLQAARQDLVMRTFNALEQLEQVCLESVQLVETANTQLRKENERLNAENERLHAQCGAGSSNHMGGTGESPGAAVRNSSAPPSRQRQNGQDQAAAAPRSPRGRNLLSTSVVPPVSLQKPSTPLGADGPPRMGIPGSIPDAERLSDIEVEEEEDPMSARSSGKDENRRPPRKSRLSAWMGSGGSGNDDEDNGSDDEFGRKKNRRRSVFADADKMKKAVREAVTKKEYDVREMYHDSGFFSWIAKSVFFDHCTLTVILINAIWIAVDLDYNHQKFILNAEPVFQVVEFFFCAYFTLELIIRFIAFRSKRDCLRDAWFMFDSLLVVTMVFDTVVITLVVVANGGDGAPGGLADPTILRMFRMLKLTRMARMVRVLRATPELMILIKGIVVAFRSVMFTLVLLMIIMYLFAIMFRSLLEDSPGLRDELFPSVSWGMLHLLLQGTLPDHETLVMKLWNESVAYGVLCIFFILMTSLTVMNMLVGVLVEVVGVVSTVEKEQMNVQFVYSKLQELLTTSGLDADGDMRISKTEFESLLLNPKAARLVQEVGVDVVGLVDFSEFLFQNDATLSFPEFMDLVLQLRGSNTATVKDVVDLRKFINSQVLEINDTIAKGQGLPSSRAASPMPSREQLALKLEAFGQMGGPAPSAWGGGPAPSAWGGGPALPSSSWAAPRPGSGVLGSSHGSSGSGQFFSSPLEAAMWSAREKSQSPQLMDEEV